MNNTYFVPKTVAGLALPPTIASEIAGPLGVFHLMRLWVKTSLHCANILSPNYGLFDEEVFDNLTLDTLGITKDRYMKFMGCIPTPSYMELENWIKSEPGVKLDIETRDRLNTEILDARFSEKEALAILSDLKLDRSSCPSNSVIMLTKLRDARSMERLTTIIKVLQVMHVMHVMHVRV